MGTSRGSVYFVGTGLVVCLLAFCAIAYTFVGCASPNGQSAPRATSIPGATPPPTPAPIEVAANDLERDKSANQVAWESKYLDKYALITGEVFSVTQAGDQYDVSLATDNFLVNVVCKVNSTDDSAAVLALAAGDLVTVHGQITDDGIIAIVIQECMVKPPSVAQSTEQQTTANATSDEPPINPFPQYQGVGATVAALTVLVETPIGTGSGFMFYVEHSKEVLVLTNRHVVGDHQDVRVCWALAQRCASASVSNRGSENFDVAAIQLPYDDPNSEFSQWITDWFIKDYLLMVRYGGEWNKGDVVLASGYPGGNRAGTGATISDPVVTEGIVTIGGSAKYGRTHYIEHGADVDPGSSGGPLINSEGSIVGIVSGTNVFAERLELAVPMVSVIEWLETGREPSLERLPTLIPTATPLPSPQLATPVVAADPTVTPSPMPTPTPEPLIGTRDNPVPLGTPVSYPDWEVSVTAFEPNAYGWIAAENRYIDPPDPGREYVLIRVNGTYTGSGVGEISSDLRFFVVGSASRIYEEDWLFVSFSLREQPDVLNGGTVSGLVAFIVPSEEVETLVLIVADGSLRNADTVGYFALR